MNFEFCPQAEEELVLRQIPRTLIEELVRNPQQIVPERGLRKAYQSKVDFGGGKTYLLRAIVDDSLDPVLVVTLYRTSKINKYWRQK